MPCVPPPKARSPPPPSSRASRPQVRHLGPYHDHREHPVRGEPAHRAHHRFERARRTAPTDLAAGGGELSRPAPGIATALASPTSQSTNARTCGRVPVSDEEMT